MTIGDGLIDQPQVRLVDYSLPGPRAQGRGLHGVMTALPPKLACCHPAKFAVNERNQFVQSGLVAATPTSNRYAP